MNTGEFHVQLEFTFLWRRGRRLYGDHSTYIARLSNQTPENSPSPSFFVAFSVGDQRVRPGYVR